MTANWVNEGRNPVGDALRDLDIGEAISNETKAFNLHIRVHQDHFYAFQSWGKVEVWSEADLSWHLVADLLPEEIHEPYEAADELRARAGALLLGGS